MKLMKLTIAALCAFWIIASASEASAQCFLRRGWFRASSCYGGGCSSGYRFAPNSSACSGGSYSGGSCSGGTCSGGACSSGYRFAPSSPSCSGGSCSGGACSSGYRFAPSSPAYSGGSCSDGVCSDGSCSGGSCSTAPVSEAIDSSAEERFVELANRSRRSRLNLSDRLRSACVRNSQMQQRYGLGHYGFNSAVELAAPAGTPDEAIRIFYENRFNSPHWNYLVSGAYSKISVGFFGGYCTVQLW